MEKQSRYEFAARVGIDWADRKHDVCLQVPDRKVEYSVIEHSPEALEAWAQGLRKRFGGRPIAVCVELAKGPLVWALQKYDFFVIFPINPKSLASYRLAWSPSGAKDDPSDARLALDILTRHPERLTELRPQSPQMRALQQLVEDRRQLVADRVSITNRLTAALKAYFPQALQCFEDKGTVVFCEFLLRFPDLQTVRRAREKTLMTFFHKHNVRSTASIERRLEAIRSAIPLTEDVGVVDPARRKVLALARQLRPLLDSIAEYDDAIAKLCDAMDDYRIFRSLPGAGPALAPRLLAAFGEDRERFGSAAELQRFSGIAPVTERSGNSSWVHFRYRCPTFMRQTFVEWAGQTIHHSHWAETYYRKQRGKGAGHHSAVRALAYKWIRVVFRCWKTNTEYDEVAYLKALKSRGSDLVVSAA